MSGIKNALATQAEAAVVNGNKKSKTIYELINDMKPEIARALPKHLDPDRVARIAITAVRSNPKLQACSGHSFLAALMTSSQLGLEPNTPLGQAYIIPYGNDAQFQLGYKGILDLCRRSGEFLMIYAHEVREQDEFSYCYGLHKDLIHKPAEGERGLVVAYYGVYHLKDGGYDFLVMSKPDVEKHRDLYSKASNKGFSPWNSAFDEMAKKTVLKQLLKYAPVSIEVQRSVSQDETIRKEIDEDMSIIPAESVFTIDVEQEEVTNG